MSVTASVDGDKVIIAFGTLTYELDHISAGTLGAQITNKARLAADNSRRLEEQRRANCALRDGAA